MEAYQVSRTVDGSVNRLERWMYRHERWMYRGRGPNRVAWVLNGLWARVTSTGFAARRMVTLEVVGRRSGRVRAIPLIVADHEGERYLVAMLGERADWVANVRAAGGRATIRHGRREPVQLEEVEPAARGPIVRRHLDLAPAARAFMPVARSAAPEQFDPAVRDVPVFRIRPGTGDAPAPARPARRRRRWVAAVIVVAALAIGVGVVAVATRPGPPPLGLPATVAQPPVGSIDGRWTATDGSIAGFRIDQIMLGMHSPVVGRTSAVTGTVDVVGSQVQDGAFTIDLASLTVEGTVRSQIAISLDSQRHPTATVRLAGPVVLPVGLADGGSTTVTTAGTLELRGVTRPVTITLSVRRDGPAIEAAGSMPIDLATWGVPLPDGFGALGSLADHGVAEFYLVLRQPAG